MCIAFTTRGKLGWDERTLCFRPSKTHEAEQSIGAANGTFDLARGLSEAIKATNAAEIYRLYQTDIDAPPITMVKQSRTPLAA